MPTYSRTASDSGLVSLVDSIYASTPKYILIDTGVTVSDSITVAHGYPRADTDTGLTVTSTIVRIIGRQVVQQGLTLTESIKVNHKTAFITDTALTIADSILLPRRPRFGDIGLDLLTNPDSIDYTVWHIDGTAGPMDDDDGIIGGGGSFIHTILGVTTRGLNITDVA